MKPQHSDEHYTLTQLVIGEVDRSDLIRGVVLITIGKDGMVCVGSNCDTPATVQALLRELGGKDRQIEAVMPILRPPSN